MTRSRVKNDFAVGIDDNAASTALTINSSQNVSLSNDLTVDTNTLVVDSTNNRVGIGTTVPDRQLQVESTTAATFALATTKNSNSGDAEYSFGEFDFLTDDSVGGLNTPVTAARIAARAKTDSSVPGGELAFYTNISGASQTQTPFERMRILSSGGITFNGDTADANALDDYEEGTWTPRFEALTTDFTTVTYIVQDGFYQKVGNTVHTWFRLRISAYTGSPAGLVVVAGWPFTPSGGVYQAGCVSYTTGWTNSPQNVYTQTNQGFAIMSKDGGAGTVGIQIGDLNASSFNDIIASLNYKV